MLNDKIYNMQYLSPINNPLQKNNRIIIIDSGRAVRYDSPINAHKVGESGELVKCSMASTNIALIEKGASSYPQNSERFSKKTMWNDFSSLEVWIRVCLYSRKMNGESKSPSLNRFHSLPAKLGNLTGFIFQEPVRSIATGKAEF